MDDTSYQYTKNDVEVMIRFLRLHYPKFATPENAIKVLVYMREQSRLIDDMSEKEFENVLKDLEDY